MEEHRSYSEKFEKICIFENKPISSWLSGKVTGKLRL